MCFGASSGSKAINNETGSTYGTAIQQAKAEFGDANTAFNDLMQTMAPIEKAGPDQMGFTAQTEAGIEGGIVNTTAAQYRNAATAVKGDIAGQGGGNIALPSGANLGTEEALAEAGANATAGGLQAARANDAAVGNANWQFATKAVQSAPQVFSTANTATADTAKVGETALASQKVIDSAPTWQSFAMGALGDAANVGTGGMSGAIGNLDTTGSSTGGEQAKNLLSGFLG